MPFINNLLELIYPTSCGFCNKICKQSLCNKCNLIVKKYYIEGNNNTKNKYFNEFLTIFKYEGMIREKIIEYKFNDKPYLYKTFSNIILKNKKICDKIKKYDIIIPVSMNKKRKQQRGYNQTELISMDIAKNIEKLEFHSNILIKQKDTKTQSMLNKSERIENVKNAFIIQNELYIKDKKILLFDDTYTTGSTVNECSKILKKAGAKSIGVLTIAKD